MSFKIINLVMMLILLSGLAFGLQITPSEALSNVYANQLHNSTKIILTNDHSFTIYNITFSDLVYFNFPIVEELQPNESTSYNFTILTNADFDRIGYTSTVSFLFLEDVPQDPIIYEIQILDGSYSPNELTLYENDDIRWTNAGNITHSITSSLWDYDLSVGETHQINFPVMTEINYFDKYIYFTGNLYIKNRSMQEYSYDSSFDKTLTVNLKSTFSSTNLSIEVIDSNFTMDWDGESEGILKVVNSGSQIAYNVSLSVSNDKFDITFDELIFNLNPNQINYVSFDIESEIDETDDTNESHTIILSLDSENAGSTENEIQVFINYHEFVEDIETEEWWIEKRFFCDENPTSELCITEPIIEYVNITIEKEPKLTLQFTEKEWKDFLIQTRKTADTSERVENQWISDVSEIKNRLTGLENKTENIEEVTIENQQERQSAKIRMWIIVISIILAACLAVVVFAIYFHQKKKKDYAAAGVNIDKLDDDDDDD